MKVLYVYALLIGFTTGAKVFTKKNGKKREHHVTRTSTDEFSPEFSLEDPMAIQAKRRKMTMKLRRQTERMIKAARKAKARAVRSSRRRSKRHRSKNRDKNGRKSRKNRKPKEEIKFNDRFSGISKLKSFDESEVLGTRRGRKAEMGRNEMRDFRQFRPPGSFNMRFSRLSPNGYRYRP